MTAHRAAVYRFSLHRNAVAMVVLGGTVAAAALFAGGVVLGLDLALAGRAEPATGAVERLTADALAAIRAQALARRPATTEGTGVPRPAAVPPETVELAKTPAPNAREIVPATPARPSADAPAALARLLPAVFDPAALLPVASDGPQVPPSLRYGGRQRVPEVPYGRAIYRIARHHSVNPDVVAALIWAESAFDPLAQSSKGARGLMQVMPATGDRFGVEPELLWEPEANLVAGVRYLSWLGERFEDNLPLVLAAYNAGEGAVDAHDGVPPFRETRTYVGKILRSLGLEESAGR